MRIGIDISIRGSGAQGSGVAAPTAPVLSVVEPVTNPPAFDVLLPSGNENEALNAATNDVFAWEITDAADTGFLSPVLTGTYTIEAGDLFSFTLSDDELVEIDAGAYIARARLERGSAVSSWSDTTDSFEIEAGYDADAETIFAAFTSPPSDPRKEAINDLVVALKAASVWDKMGVLYVFAAADSQAAKINWKNPGTLDVSEVGSPTFTADVGYNSNGSTSLTVGAAPSSIPGIAQDDNHLGAFFSGTVTSAILWGRTDSNGRFAMSVVAGGVVDSRLASTTALQSGTAAAGHVVGVRTGASAVQHYVNGASVATGSPASSDLGSGNARLLFSNGTHAPSGTILKIAHAGAALSALDVAAIDTAFDAYLGAL